MFYEVPEFSCPLIQRGAFCQSPAPARFCFFACFISLKASSSPPCLSVRPYPRCSYVLVRMSSLGLTSSPHPHTFFFSFSPQSSTHTFTHTKIRGHKEHYFDSRSLPGIASLPFSRFMSRLPFFSTHPCLSLKQCPCRCPCSSVLIFYSLLIFS